MISRNDVLVAQEQARADRLEAKTKDIDSQLKAHYRKGQTLVVQVGALDEGDIKEVIEAYEKVGWKVKVIDAIRLEFA